MLLEQFLDPTIIDKLDIHLVLFISDKKAKIIISGIFLLP